MLEMLEENAEMKRTLSKKHNLTYTGYANPSFELTADSRKATDKRKKRPFDIGVLDVEASAHHGIIFRSGSASISNDTEANTWNGRARKHPAV